MANNIPPDFLKGVIQTHSLEIDKVSVTENETLIGLKTNLSNADQAAFLKRCIKSGMREAHCEKCGCFLLTRGKVDLCPPCRGDIKHSTE